MNIVAWLVVAWVLAFGTAASVRALDAADLTFYLSFDHGMQADFARGDPSPVRAGEPKFVEGLIGKGIVVGPENAVTDYETENNILPETGTISVWLKRLQDAASDVNSNLFGVSGSCIGIGSAGTLGRTLFSGALIIYTAQLRKDTWNHLAATWRQGDVKTYVNGELIGSYDKIALPGKWSGPMRVAIGANGPGAAREQQVIDEFMIFNRVLVPAEVKALYEKPGYVAEYDSGDGRGLHKLELKRGNVPSLVSVGRMRTPPSLDGQIGADEWRGATVISGWIDTRLGVMDGDPSEIYLGHDNTNLYLAVKAPVPAEVRENRILYASTAFKADAQVRDGSIKDDDFFEFQFRPNPRAPVCSLAVNPRGALCDARGEDRSWNANATVAHHTDLDFWQVEMAIPLQDLGLAPGAQAEFNVLRSWKHFRQAETAWSVDRQSQPAFCPLIPTEGPAVELHAGDPARGVVDLALELFSAQAGVWKVNASVGDERKTEELALRPNERKPFKWSPALMAGGASEQSVTVTDPKGPCVLSHSMPFAYAPLSTTTIAFYPTSKLLEVEVAPLPGSLVRLSAVTTVVRQGTEKPVAEKTIGSFAKPIERLPFDLKALPQGAYEVVTVLKKENSVLARQRSPFEIRPAPVWAHNAIGITKEVPQPWTAVKAQGSRISCWGRTYAFEKSLLPSGITTQGTELLAAPMRLVLPGAEPPVPFTMTKWTVTEKAARKVSFRSQGQAADVSCEIQGSVEFDGLCWIEVRLGTAADAKPFEMGPLSLEIPLQRSAGTLRLYNDDGLVGNQPSELGPELFWVGNEAVGFQFFTDERRGWVGGGRSTMITPGKDANVIRVPLVDQKSTIPSGTVIAFGFMATPSRPRPKDWRRWRYCQEQRPGTGPGQYIQNYGWGWSWINYPVPKQVLTPANIATWEKTGHYPPDQEIDRSFARWQKSYLSENGLECFYMCGPLMWNGAPEYKHYWREWRPIPSPVQPYDPDGKSFAPVCFNSLAPDLILWLLKDTVNSYPSFRGLYFDNMMLNPCTNRQHGCGYLVDDGECRPTLPWRATRQFYERIYNVMHGARGAPHIQFHQWGPDLRVSSFCDSICDGEQFAGLIGSRQERNYYQVLPLSRFRAEFTGKQFGPVVMALDEFASAGGNSPENRHYWYGTKAGDQWTIPGMAEVEHFAGMVFLHDSKTCGSFSIAIPTFRIHRAEDEFGWDEAVEFKGYWENGELLAMDGGVPEKIVCSLYDKPPAAGQPAKLMLVPFNNTDAEATVVLKPNLARFNLTDLKNGVLRDAYQSQEWTYQWENTVMPGDTEKPAFHIKGTYEKFPMQNGAATVTLKKRNFRILILEKP